jgi:hypothetical protein
MIPNGGSEEVEAYVNGEQTKFVVTDDLRVLPLSLASLFRLLVRPKFRC